mmetsp:Transcript_11419/g.22968  ORF Transcript_11419/g.22968 Transcript_11419/m.22968 type:complete len:212 (+) Transcript_11419:610-1245(+)
MAFRNPSRDPREMRIASCARRRDKWQVTSFDWFLANSISTSTRVAVIAISRITPRTPTIQSRYTPTTLRTTHPGISGYSPAGGGTPPGDDAPPSEGLGGTPKLGIPPSFLWCWALARVWWRVIITPLRARLSPSLPSPSRAFEISSKLEPCSPVMAHTTLTNPCIANATSREIPDFWRISGRRILGILYSVRFGSNATTGGLGSPPSSSSL